MYEGGVRKKSAERERRQRDKKRDREIDGGLPRAAKRKIPPEKEDNGLNQGLKEREGKK